MSDLWWDEIDTWSQVLNGIRWSLEERLDSIRVDISWEENQRPGGPNLERLQEYNRLRGLLVAAFSQWQNWAHWWQSVVAVARPQRPYTSWGQIVALTMEACHARLQMALDETAAAEPFQF